MSRVMFADKAASAGGNLHALALLLVVESVVLLDD